MQTALPATVATFPSLLDASLPFEATAAGATAPGTLHQVVIIDANVADAATLAAAAPAGSLVFMLDGARSGVEQVGEILKSVGQVDSLHLVSHGGPGYFLLGSDVVSSDTASHYAADFQSWSPSLHGGADLLFYGCQVAASADGQALVGQIGAWTGADVAASTNLSGIDGDWVLEYQQGVVEAQALAGQAYQHDLVVGPTTYVVTTLDDQVFGGGDLAAAGADGLSLREAVALAKGGLEDTIVFASSLFADGQMHTLTLTHGEIDITGAGNADSINIVGAGAALLTISGNNSSRIFYAYTMDQLTSTTTISDLTLSNGKTGSEGGAIRMYESGSLVLDHVVIKNSVAGGSGGAVGFVGSASTFSMSNSTISGNTAGGNGGGLAVSAGTDVTISASTLNGNTAKIYGGAIQASGGGLFDMVNSTIDGNTAGTLTNKGLGGGLYLANFRDGATLLNNTISDNAQLNSANSGSSGGGIAGYIPGDLNLVNNLFSGNTTANATGESGKSTDLALRSTVAEGSHNIIAEAGLFNIVGSNAVNNLSGSITSVPTLGALADNGGPVQTRAILDASSAVDAGTATGAPTLDARGQVRGSSVDIGAYEFYGSFTGSLSPANGNGSVALGANLTLDFSLGASAVAAVAAKNIVIHNSGGSVFETIAATDARVTISGNVVTLNPSADLVAGNAYYVTIDSGAFTAVGDTKAFAGLSGASAWSFTAAAPVVSISVSMLALSSDTGGSSTDFITSTAAQTVTATLSAALAGGDIVYGSVDNGAHWVVITDKVSGTAISWDTATLAGSSALAFKVSSGGVDGPTASQNYVLDTTAPDAPNAPDLASASDLGTSNSDKLTSSVTPTFTGSRDGDTIIKLYDGNTSTLLGTDSTSGGSWSIVSSTLSSGAHTVYATATDTAGNESLLSTGLTLTIDNTAPAVLSINRLGAATSNATSVSYTVTFAESVTGVDASDFTLAASGGVAGTIASVSGSGATYTVTVDNVSGDGTLRLDLNGASTAISDAAGNAITSGFGAGQLYTFDHTAPTAAIALSDRQLTSGETALVTVTFSEAVTGFGNASLALAGGSLSTFSSSDGGLTWHATLTPNSGLNTEVNALTLDMTGITDLAGNGGSGTIVSSNYSVHTVVVPPPELPPELPPVVVPPVVIPPATGLPVVPGRSTVDGVILDTSISTDPATGLSQATIVIPVIPVTRPDDPSTPNAALADIPLGLSNGTGGVAVHLTVGLPTGTGLQVEGSTSLLTNQQALLDLTHRIEQKTETGSSVQTEMTGLGADFLKSLFGDVLLQSMSMTPSVAPGSTTPQTILITGGSTTPAGGTHNPGAIGLVIDASGLPSNVVLQLNDVDFAAVIGAATLRGGDGQNFVIGDGASQNIMLGADDDLLFGGGGDDIIGSAGGNDILDGGSGNDKVAGGIGNDSLTGGSGNDVLQGGRSDSGAWKFFINGSGALVAEHQTALFAPGATETLVRADLNAAAPELGFLASAPEKLVQLAGLYQSVFGRVADLQGLAFWAASGDSLVNIAGNFLDSAEWSSTGNGALSDAAFLQKLYQQALGRAPDAAGLKFWLDALGGSAHAPADSRAEVLLSFALSPELHTRLDSGAGIAVGAGLVTQESGWIAGGGDDRLDGGAGSDTLVGGDGVDTVVYGGTLANYKILLGADGQVRIADKAGSDIDTISGIELGQFGDTSVDLSFTQADTASLRVLGLMYQTVLDRAGDLDGFSHGIALHLNTLELAQGFTASAEYKARYAGASDAQFVHALYQNTGIDATAPQEKVWLDYLDTHTRTELIARWVETDSVARAQFDGAGLWLV